MFFPGPLDTYNPPVRSSRQDIRGSIQFFHGDYQNGSQEEKRERKNSQTSNSSAQNWQPQNSQPQNWQPQNWQPQNSQPQNSQPQNSQPQNSQPQNTQQDEQPYFPIRRQLSTDTVNLSQLGFSNKGGGDGFFLNDRDATDGDGTKTSFADLNRIRSNGDQGLC
jgi:hypothetical protein